ncbi:energy-coupling factor transporter transmembrane component T, partial [Bartonella sp. CL63NXGY]|uniref:energy-coupling factor transporter transmembrane component T n=1 Tax=Bartonella sp. CL63NXGY TaxID=3243538 RepID=UPI0035D04647
VIITASTVLTATTPTLQLAAAFAALLKPLRYLKIPVDQMTLMLSVALRFVPTIMQQLHQIMNAQRSRGMQFNQGGLIARCHHLLPVLIPLFINSFQRSEELATAMEARG